MCVARGWRERPEMDETAAKESEMNTKGVGDGRGSVSMCSRQLKIACNSVVNEENFLGDFLFLSSYFCTYTICLSAVQHFIKSLVILFIT